MKPTPAPESSPTSAGAAIEVWLVHGTWAHGPRSFLWNLLPERWRPTAVDWPEMRSGLERAGYPVRDFVWPGHNRHTARRKAGEDLADAIRERRGATRARTVIVSHSHGGNVALYAAARLDPAPDGIVFLAVPFLHFEPLELELEAFRRLPAVLGGLFGFAAFFGWLFLFLTHLENRPLPDVATVLLGVAVGSIAAWLVHRLARAVGRGGANALALAKSEASALQPVAPATASETPRGDGRARAACKLLWMRKTGDEASAALLAGQAAEWVAGLLWKLLAWFLEGPDRWIARHPRLVTGFLVALAAVVTFGTWVIDEDFGSRLFGVLTLGLLALVILVALLQLPLAALLVLVGWARFGWGGWRALLMPLAMRVSVEPVLEGTWPLRMIRGSGSGGLAHSEIYRDAKVITEIVRWLGELDGPRQSAAPSTQGP